MALTIALFASLTGYAQHDQPSVELSSFNVQPSNRSITVAWSTATETGNQGFEIHRSGATDTAVFQPIASYLTDPELTGMGTSSSGRSYAFTDNDATLIPGTYCYRLISISHPEFTCCRWMQVVKQSRWSSLSADRSVALRVEDNSEF
jgi:hypothetical protein